MEQASRRAARRAECRRISQASEEEKWWDDEEEDQDEGGLSVLVEGAGREDATLSEELNPAACAEDLKHLMEHVSQSEAAPSSAP